MIKSFKDTDLEAFDKQINEFLDEKKDCAVRTLVVPCKHGDSISFVYFGTVFWDKYPKEKRYWETKNTKESNKSDLVSTDTDDTISTGETELDMADLPDGDGEPQKSAQLGALWKRPDGKVTGKFKGVFIVMDAENKKNLKQRYTQEGKPMFYGELKGVEVVIVPNKFKKTSRHPDYVILPAKKE